MPTEKMNMEQNENTVITNDETIIDDAVAFINEKANETLYKGAVEIGEYILDTFFQGRLEIASSKNPKKKNSFNKLCEREDLIIHPNKLGVMVRVASQEKFFIEEKIDTKTLSYTHKASLVKVMDKNQKAKIVKECITEKWTTRKLEEVVKKHLNTLSSSPKPSPIRTAKKYITKIEDVIKTVDASELNFDMSDVSKMASKRRDALKGHLTALDTKAKEGMDRAKNISKQCGKVLEKLEEIEEKKKNKTTEQGESSTETAK